MSANTDELDSDSEQFCLHAYVTIVNDLGNVSANTDELDSDSEQFCLHAYVTIGQRSLT